MSKFNNLRIYDLMLTDFYSNRKYLKEQFKSLDGACSSYTLKFYEKQISICNKYIKALKIAKKNQIFIDKILSKY